MSINKTFLRIVFVHVFFFWGGGGVMLNPTQYWAMHLCGKLFSLRSDSIFFHERASVFFTLIYDFHLVTALDLGHRWLKFQQRVQFCAQMVAHGLAVQEKHLNLHVMEGVTDFCLVCMHNLLCAL